jgi:predicted GH43/DUF377 family glycosyl hydrolase
MDALRPTRDQSVRLVPDPRRVITKPFLPREEIYPDGRSRMQIVLERILAMPDDEIAATFSAACDDFAGRHRDLDAVMERNFAIASARLDHLDLLTALLSPDRRRLIGAYFTHEYSIEAAALGNPSIVVAPDQSGLDHGEARFVMSLRAIGEGHISSIEFRSGVVASDGNVRLLPPGPFAETGVTSSEPGSSGYRTSFSASTDVSERVLFPSTATESHGMEDARFVRFVDDDGDDGDVTYYATYTAFDGHQILPQLLETTDFVDFRITTLSGRVAHNKGMAIFPRRIDGRYAALSRQDNVNNFFMTSSDVRVWSDATVIQEPERPWELMQLGNCGSPLETEAGWLVITHGVGPFRRYTLGALLLDLDDPTRVIGHLKEPLLAPNEHERDGYVPNVVYSCGAMIHGEHLVLPYGYADVGASVATIPLRDLLSALTRPAR